MSTAYFAGGCFWCVTPVFKMLDGVSDVISGYSGGVEVNPAYEDVKYQRTGHRETIKIEYDAARITFEALFKVFLSSVDPFDGEGQFIDRGHSYTLAVYYTNGSERQVAQGMIDELRSSSGREVYISLEPFRNFYDAEEYHQNYYLKNPEAFEKELIESGRKPADGQPTACPIFGNFNLKHRNEKTGSE